MDDAVGSLVNALAETNQLDNTYIFYTSDNGYLNYQHRWEAKGVPYEDSIGVPLIVRGPGVGRGDGTNRLVSQIDLAPTFATLAGIPAAASASDGRPLTPLLDGNPNDGQWREKLLSEYRIGRGFDVLIKADGTRYVEHGTSERELYHLGADPYQLQNAYRTADPASIAKLEDQLAALKACAAATCRQAENAP